ncbi:hypothetical protein [Hymenobacter rigui]|uniref:Uncharacterized protein n=1 Tax=Hymenobacter rigui TaxID=334424 RepID=A0A3R9V9A9_9BACT|nr:hypothetical protein [Hymenobacter rigui]RSK49384.1 hypothetical protein EI291_07785 [Hymenobacter rigui]
MRSAATTVAPAPVGEGGYTRRRCFPEREMTVGLFGGLREVMASVAYYVQWISDEFYSYKGAAPHVQLRGVYCLRTGRPLYVGARQEQALQEQLEAQLHKEGRP